MAVTKDEILDAISNMTVLELSELLSEFEEKFGVTAAAPVAVAAVGGAGASVDVMSGRPPPPLASALTPRPPLPSPRARGCPVPTSVRAPPRPWGRERGPADSMTDF